jgi:hypothetical protein
MKKEAKKEMTMEEKYRDHDNRITKMENMISQIEIILEKNWHKKIIHIKNGACRFFVVL